MEQQRKKKKLGRNACPKCSPGFVEHVAASMFGPTNLHCIICGNREYIGFPDTSGIQRDLEPEPIGSGHGVPKRSHKKKQVGLTYAGVGA